jgi:AcrR family transcriptional regulator
MQPASLRERKKTQTRQLIADTARQLFLEHGFEAVTVDEVAQAAQVSKKTVFNYFPTKEDLLLHRAEQREQELVQAIHEWSSDESIVEAFRRISLERLERLDEQLDAHRLGGFHQLIESSPALLARVRELQAHLAVAVTQALRERTGAAADDPRPAAVAEMLLGAQRALWQSLRADLRTGDSLRTVTRRQRQRVDAVFALLRDGLGGYGHDGSARPIR